MSKKSDRNRPPNPPALEHLPLVNASSPVAQWLDHYWRKLCLPATEARRLGVTDDRSEFARWTGRRLNPLALGCYCYLPDASGGTAIYNDANVASSLRAAPAAAPSRMQMALPGFGEPGLGDVGVGEVTPVPKTDYRHLIFVEPDLLPLGIEVTVAHELIHLADRVQGNPRKHRCHGYDSISVDEAAVTGQDPELLRALLREETVRREEVLRKLRPYRFVYACPNCNKEYLRVRRYARPVSCGRCDRHYNPMFLLELRATLDGAGAQRDAAATAQPSGVTERQG
jgi:hypothetical protein